MKTFAGLGLGAALVPVLMLWLAPMGRRQRRRRMINGSIALSMALLMLIGPNQLYGLHIQHLMYKTTSEAVAAAGLGAITEADYSYSYDDNGNLVGITGPSKSNTYVYNAENRLVRAKIGIGVESNVAFGYDAAGTRTYKTVLKTGTVTHTDYLTDSNGHLSQVIAEKKANGDLVVHYTHGHDLISQRRGSTTKYYHYDGQMSTRFLTKADGNDDNTYDFDAFGNLLDSTGGTVNDFMYSGEQLDANTGFYYLRARYYNPANGRFISKDPFEGSTNDPISLHKYLYANDNPVNYIDPSGQMSLSNILTSSFIRTTLISIRSAGLVKALKYATNILVGGLVVWDWYEGIMAGNTCDAYTIGVGGTFDLGKKSPYGFAYAVEGAIGRHTGNWALFGAVGGSTNNNNSLGGYVGLAYGTETSDDYRGGSRALTISFGSTPPKVKKYIKNQLQTFLPRLQQAFMQRSGEIGAMANSIDPQIVAKLSNAITTCLSKAFGQIESVTFWGGFGFVETSDAFGFTITPDLVSGGTSDWISTSIMGYRQIIPWKKQVDF
ncbi:MAG: RHS repeat domain-containing protein [Planctomycetota bacterium]|jgi:RHS repeat-associated protein